MKIVEIRWKWTNLAKKLIGMVGIWRIVWDSFLVNHYTARF